MRIIAKKPDYYDGVQRMGADPLTIYLRKPTEIDIVVPALRLYSDLRWVFQVPVCVDVVTVGFCGNFHLMFGVTFDYDNNPIWFTKFDDAIKFVINSGKTKREREERQKYFVEKIYNRQYFYRGTLSPKVINDWITAHLVRDDDVFVAIDSPIFVVRRKSTLKNEWTTEKDAILKHLDFQKVKDPFTAYQEIAMYLSGPLTKRMDPDVDIDDETMASMKGFDRKSFRTDSPGKKKKRRDKK